MSLSDLRERLTQAAVEALGEHVFEASAAHATIANAQWPLIEAALQEKDREIAQLRTWVFKLQPDYAQRLREAKALDDLTPEELQAHTMTIEEVRAYLGLEP